MRLTMTRVSHLGLFVRSMPRVNPLVHAPIAEPPSPPPLSVRAGERI